jgi:hypothetical protein
MEVNEVTAAIAMTDVIAITDVIAVNAVRETRINPLLSVEKRLKRFDIMTLQKTLSTPSLD